METSVLLRKIGIDKAAFDKAVLEAQDLALRFGDTLGGRRVQVYGVFTSDGGRIGVNFAPKGVKVGDCSHYDHGAGVGLNQDAITLYVV